MKSILNLKFSSAILLLMLLLYMGNSFGQNCTPPPPPGPGGAGGGGGGGGGGECGDPNGPNKGKFRKCPTCPWIEIVTSHDPNEIVGPLGYGVPRFVAKSNAVNYEIEFENDGLAASAPAQKVKVTYSIGPHQNINSFSLGDFGFNSFRFQIPPNHFSYNTRLNLIDSLGLYVDITAGADVVNNQLFWIFQSIDPATGLPPANPNVGFLSVKDT